MKLMPEDERLMMLDELKKTKVELTNALESLPISLQTAAARNRKTDLEQSLLKVEKNLTIFSRKTVYIAM